MAKVAVSITKVFEVELSQTIGEGDALEELRHRMEVLDEEDSDAIDWYDIEAEHEIWSYAVIEE